MAANFEAITDRIIAALENGTIPWKRPWNKGFPKNAISKKEYRGINLFMLALSGGTSQYWLTYNQAKALGGYIKAGSKGTQIVFWNFTKVKAQKADGTDYEKAIPFLRTYTVFNLDQTEGIDAAKLPVEKVIDFEPMAACEAIVTGYQNAPTILEKGNQACYIPSQDTVEMPKREHFHSIPEYYSTLFHELVHSTGAEKRLNRLDKGGYFGSETYSKEELVAEIGASFLCGMTGIEPTTIENSAAYIHSWLKRLKDDKKLIITAAAQAQKAVDLIQGKDYQTHEE